MGASQSTAIPRSAVLLLEQGIVPALEQQPRLLHLQQLEEQCQPLCLLKALQVVHGKHLKEQARPTFEGFLGWSLLKSVILFSLSIIFLLSFARAPIGGKKNNTEHT